MSLAAHIDLTQEELENEAKRFFSLFTAVNELVGHDILSDEFVELTNISHYAGQIANFNTYNYDQSYAIALRVSELYIDSLTTAY